MESLTQMIDNSDDELIKTIKYHVEDKLFEYHNKIGIEISYDLRDICILDIKKILEKKYFNNRKFEEKKENIIKMLVETVITKEYLENQ